MVEASSMSVISLISHATIVVQLVMVLLVLASLTSYCRQKRKVLGQAGLFTLQGYTHGTLAAIHHRFSATGAFRQAHEFLETGAENGLRACVHVRILAALVVKRRLNG